jgi:hypothetical protein
LKHFFASLYFIAFFDAFFGAFFALRYKNTIKNGVNDHCYPCPVVDAPQVFPAA